MSYKGIHINEVWDYRLSSAVPTIRRDKTWIVEIHAKVNPDFNPNDPSTLALPLKTHDTGILVEDGDHHHRKKVAVCYKWLRSVRDEYSLHDIEERKPLVARIVAAMKDLADFGGEG